MTFRVVLVEDDAAVRGVIEILLATEPDFELIGTAVTAEQGIRLVEALVPDLVLLDNQLEGAMTGVQAAPSMKLAAPSALVLLCTALDLAEVADSATAIDGYLRKDNLAALVDQVRRVLLQRGSA